MLIWSLSNCGLAVVRKVECIGAEGMWLKYIHKSKGGAAYTRSVSSFNPHRIYHTMIEKIQYILRLLKYLRGETYEPYSKLKKWVTIVKYIRYNNVSDKMRDTPLNIALWLRELPKAKGSILLYILIWVLIQTLYIFF